MGSYLNPGNEKFEMDISAEIYLDKTGMIQLCNQMMRTPQRYICMSRPRRFGKSITANMLAAYYSRGCDSRELFSGYEIAKTEKYAEHLNQYHVMFINMQDVYNRTKIPFVVIIDEWDCIFRAYQMDTDAQNRIGSSVEQKRRAGRMIEEWVK